MPEASSTTPIISSLWNGPAPNSCAQAGIEQDVLLQAGIAFVVSRTEIDFRAAARFNELLTVMTQVTEVKRASMRFHSRSWRLMDG